MCSDSFLSHTSGPCLTLASGTLPFSQGVETEEILEVLSHVPQAEKFANFWICKVKLLARSGPFDAAGLYRAAVCAGAVVSEGHLSDSSLGSLQEHVSSRSQGWILG